MASKMAVKGRSKNFQSLYTEAMTQHKSKRHICLYLRVAPPAEKPHPPTEDMKGDAPLLVVSGDHPMDASYSEDTLVDASIICIKDLGLVSMRIGDSCHVKISFHCVRALCDRIQP